jgi:hypothetical protein
MLVACCCIDSLGLQGCLLLLLLLLLLVVVAVVHLSLLWQLAAAAAAVDVLQQALMGCLAGLNSILQPSTDG